MSRRYPVEFCVDGRRERPQFIAGTEELAKFADDGVGTFGRREVAPGSNTDQRWTLVVVPATARGMNSKRWSTRQRVKRVAFGFRFRAVSHPRPPLRRATQLRVARHQHTPVKSDDHEAGWWRSPLEGVAGPGRGFRADAVR